VKINRENTNLWSKKKEKRALKENRKSQSTHGIRENNNKKKN